MNWQIIQGDCRDVLATLPAQSAHTCVTSPPYFGLRDYGHGQTQIGLEPTPDEFVTALVAVFREVRRVLRDDGTVWLNLGDTYAAQTGERTKGNGGPALVGTAQQGRSAVHRPRRPPVGVKPKDLLGIPWLVAFALRADGWFLRSEIIWHKPNPMPESVTDRPTKSHEQVFLLSKSPKYFYDADAIREDATPEGIAREGRARLTAYDAPGQPSNRRTTSDGEWLTEGRNRRSVWTVATQPYAGAHFATFPPKLVEPCILAGCPEGGTVLDPFAGAGTTGIVAQRNGRSFVGIELNAEYARLARERIATDIRLGYRPPVRVAAAEGAATLFDMEDAA